MKGFFNALRNAVKKDVQAFEKAASKTVEAIGNPNVPQSDVDQVWHDATDTAKETGSDAFDAAREEIKEHGGKIVDAGGRAVEQAGQKLKQVKDLADKGITNAPKAGLAAKAGVLAVTAAVVGTIGFFFARPSSDQGQRFAETMGRNDIALAQADANIQLSVSAERFQEMGKQLNIPEIPPSVFQPLAAAAPATPAIYVPPPAAPLPEAVAAIAATPVTVEVNNGASTYRGRTNVGEVYRAVPESREPIEHHASTIQHDYIDKSLLNPNRVPDEPRVPERQWQHHVNIDVNTEFGASAHFHM